MSVVYRPGSGSVTYEGTPTIMLSGSVAPTADIGEDGNFYILLTTPRVLYGPKADGAWPAGVALKAEPTISTSGPSGTPEDGEEWIVV